MEFSIAISSIQSNRYISVGLFLMGIKSFYPDIITYEQKEKKEEDEDTTWYNSSFKKLRGGIQSQFTT